MKPDTFLNVDIDWPVTILIETFWTTSSLDCALLFLKKPKYLTVNMQPCCTAARRAISRRLLSNSALTQAAASSSSASTSSTTSATSYSRPVAAGKLPIYDEALAFIEQDKKEKFKTLEQLNKQLNDLGQDASQRRRKDLLRKITATEIASTINDPETRWHFRNGSGGVYYLI
jgi:hypothetical protein